MAGPAQDTDDGRYDGLTDRIVEMIDAEADPEAACIAVMSGLAGLIVAQLGRQEGCSLLYRFADEIVELEKDRG